MPLNTGWHLRKHFASGTIMKNELRTLILALAFSCTVGGFERTNAATPAVKPATSAAPKAATTSGASALIARGETAYLSGNGAEALKFFQEALAAAQGAQDKKGIAASLERLGNYQQSQKDITEEETLRTKALQAAKQAYGANSAQTAMQLAQTAGMLLRKGAIGEARESLDQGKAILAKAGDGYPIETAVCAMNEASLQVAQGLPAMAEDSLKHACTLLTANDASRYYLALALQEQAAVLDQLERKDEAKAIKEKLALLRGTSTAGSAPVAAVKTGNPAFDKHVKDAQAAVIRQDRDAAMTSWKLALAEAEKGSPSDGRQAFVLIHLGDEHVLKNRTPEAEMLFKRALELRKQANATKTLGTARNLWRLANCAIRKNDFKEAEFLLSRAVEIEDECHANDSIVAGTLTPLVTAASALKNVPKTESVCKRLLVIANDGRVKNAAMLKTMAIGVLGGLYVQAGRFQEGMGLMKQIATQKPPEAAEIQQASMQEFIKIEQLFDESEQRAFATSTTTASQ